MDTFNFLVSVLLMMIAIQAQETWIVLAILTISILTSKELTTAVMFIVAAGVLYFVIGSGDTELWPVAILGLVVLGIVLGSKPAPEQGAAGGYGDMFGGGLGGGAY